MIESFVSFIGNLALPCVILSVFAMLLVELISKIFKLRARLLSRSIRVMLADQNGSGLANALYTHPLIRSLFPGGCQPSYIPGRIFAKALVDQITGRAKTNNLGLAVQKIPEENLRRGLEAILFRTNPGMERSVIQNWFLEVMDQASGLYRWQTHLLLIVVGTALIVPLNFDAIRISSHVSQSHILEKLLEARVDTLAKLDAPKITESKWLTQRAEELASLQTLSFPLGWSEEFNSRAFKTIVSQRRFPNWVLLKIIGLLTSILAVMLCSPLIFDTLNRFTIVRLTVKPWESFAGVESASGKSNEPEGEAESH